MIPTRLEMQNFLAYRAPDPIVFEGLQLACLSGSNGAGKSSILDAMTWALWGKARTRRDNELIHQGQSDMQVQMEFVQDGTRYRVRRRRSSSGRSSRSGLDLLMWDADDQPQLINEVSMRATQERINAILRLDYETFVHSAFLQQGRADAFTVKTPADRKAILRDILGLAQWTVWEERAKDRLSAVNREIEVIQHDMQRIDREVDKELEVQGELDAVVEEYEAAQARLEAHSKELDRVANSQAALQREGQNRQQQQSRIRARQEDITAAAAEIERQDEKIAGFQSTIDQSAAIEAGYQQLLSARENQSAIAEQLTQMKELDARHHQLERQLASKKSALESERGVIRERIHSLQQQAGPAADADLQAVAEDLLQLEALNLRRDEMNRVIQALKQERAGLKTRLEVMANDGRALNERLQRLQAAEGGSCPLCGQILTEQHRNEIVMQLTNDRQQLREEYRQRQQRIREIEADSREQQKEVDGLGLRLKDLPALQQRQGALAQQAAKAREAQTALELEREQLEQIENRLSAGDYAQELRRQLSEVDAERQRIAYDPNSHADIKTRLETYRSFDRQHTQLELAQINLPEAKKIRQRADARLQALQSALKEDQAALEAIDSQIAQLKVQVEEERGLRAEIAGYRAEVQSLHERRTIRQQELNAILAGRESIKRLQSRLDEGLREQGICSELRMAFGRNGVPAMIMETAIPELETEANQLLGRMTDWQMSLSLKTQREKASGGMIETLDIEIADELGTRAYETYSGGEAFRINFALRIALSKLLARQAGAQLRVLFIDEGFGSQDEDGRSKLVEAINRIQDDFDLILVITHIDELRDSFPVHLVVEKTAEGSLVALH